MICAPLRYVSSMRAMSDKRHYSTDSRQRRWYAMRAAGMPPFPLDMHDLTVAVTGIADDQRSVKFHRRVTVSPGTADHMATTSDHGSILAVQWTHAIDGTAGILLLAQPFAALTSGQCCCSPLRSVLRHGVTRLKLACLNSCSSRRTAFIRYLTTRL